MGLQEFIGFLEELAGFEDIIDALDLERNSPLVVVVGAVDVLDLQIVLEVLELFGGQGSLGRVVHTLKVVIKIPFG